MKKNKVQTFPDEELFIVKKRKKKTNTPKISFMSADGIAAATQTDAEKSTSEPNKTSENIATQPVSVSPATQNVEPVQQSATISPTETRRDVDPAPREGYLICDAAIDNIDINVSGNTANVSVSSVKGASQNSAFPTGVIYSLNGGALTPAENNFELTNLPIGNHNLSIRPICLDARSPSTNVQTKTFTIYGNPVCDAIIGQFNIYVDGTTATISTTTEKGNAPNSDEPTGIIYSLDGAEPKKTTKTFQLTNLSAGNHTITVSAWCAGGGSPTTQTKTFTISQASGGGGVTPPAPKLCDVEIIDVKINAVSAPTGNDVNIQVSYGGTLNLKPVGVAYQSPLVKNGELQLVNGDNFTLRSIPAGENRVTLYPICEGNVVGSKSVTKVFTITPNVPSTNTTTIGGGGIRGGFGGGGGLSQGESTSALQVSETTFLGRNWWWLLALGVVAYYATKKDKK